MIPARAANAAGEGFHVAYPIEAVGKLRGVVVLDVAPRSEPELQAVLRQLHWGAAGLQVLFARDVIARESAAKERLQSVLELVAAAATHDRFSASATALATELATQAALRAGQHRVPARRAGQDRRRVAQCAVQGAHQSVARRRRRHGRSHRPRERQWGIRHPRAWDQP